MNETHWRWLAKLANAGGRVGDLARLHPAARRRFRVEVGVACDDPVVPWRGFLAILCDGAL